MLFSPQIPLQLDPRRPDRFEDFVAGPNGAAVAALQDLLEQPGSGVFLRGAPGSGKSHLLNALCHTAREQELGAFYIPLKRLTADAAGGLQGLQGLDLVCVDDLDHVAGQREWEDALFHCFNQVRAARGRLVVSSSRPLADIEFSLPDLASRLAWGLRLELRSLDDAGKLEVLQKRSDALGLELPPEVLQYLVRRSPRDTRSLLEVLERVRQAAFAAKRRITVPLARQILEAENKTP